MADSWRDRMRDLAVGVLRDCHRFVLMVVFSSVALSVQGYVFGQSGLPVGPVGQPGGLSNAGGGEVVPSLQGVPSVPSIEGLSAAGAQPVGAQPVGAQPVGGQVSGVGNPLGVKVHERLELPRDAGQYWVEYDLKPYTMALKGVDRPQQAVIDWIIRETGSDLWFQEPVGVLTADRSTLRVYHNAGMQKVVAQVYERFVNGINEPQVYSLRLITIGNPNWRSKALPLMRSAAARSPGVSAWLMPKENGAIVMAQLRQRQDVRELQSVDLRLVQGQTQVIEQMRPRNYLREYAPNTTSAWPPLTPTYGEIQEGYRMVFSPLLSLDGSTMDMMLKCQVDQVEKMNAVPLEVPGAGGAYQVEVPQMITWQMAERFKWPTDHVLILSCGVIAPPVVNAQSTLLTGGAGGLFGINRILPDLSFQKQDAILVVEYRGSASTQLVPGGIAAGGLAPGGVAAGGVATGGTANGGVPAVGMTNGVGTGVMVPGVAGGNSLRGRY
ncbi:MAG: hypothetical protein LW720_05365 [Pirellula sp.]|nr:hypothetical protein [Pirellula sp.]